MLSTYASALLGVWVILFTVMVQGIVAGVAHRRQSHYIPGIVDPALSHASFVFRSSRTFLNSQENLLLMLGTAMVAMLSGLDVVWVTNCVWIYAVARIVHMALYYAIATEKNPSPRSYFYTIALLANVVLLVKLGLHLLG